MRRAGWAGSRSAAKDGGQGEDHPGEGEKVGRPFRSLGSAPAGAAEEALKGEEVDGARRSIRRFSWGSTPQMDEEICGAAQGEDGEANGKGPAGGEEPREGPGQRRPRWSGAPTARPSLAEKRDRHALAPWWPLPPVAVPGRTSRVSKISGD